MSIIAVQGDDRYLVEIRENVGRVLDTTEATIGPEFNIHSILARGYWEPVDPNDERMSRALEAAVLMIGQE